MLTISTSLKISCLVKRLAIFPFHAMFQKASSAGWDCLAYPLQNDKILDLSNLKALADNKCHSKFEIDFGKDRKHCGEKRKCWLPAFSSFPTMFSKAR